MKITKRQLRRIIREEAEATIKYNADPALQGDQTKLPDELQKAIIDKDEEEEELKEIRITRHQLRRIIKEAMTPVDPKVKQQLISWWKGIREPGVKYTWKEIQEDVLATLPERGYGVGLTNYIDSLSWEETDELFRSVFGGGRWRR